MANIQLENLDNSPISFDLSPEDIEVIKGGTTAPVAASSINPFPIIIVAFPIRIYTIIIKAAPPSPTA